MLAGIILGVLAGYFFSDLSQVTGLIGELFLRLLTLLIVPVIVVSMLAGILNLDDSGSLGRLGIKTILYYASTTALAVLIGLFLVNYIEPGKGETQTISLEQTNTEHTTSSEEYEIAEVIKNIIPPNIVKAGMEGKVLGLIFFPIFLGIALLHVKEPGIDKIKSIISALFSAIIWMVDKAMLIAPVGVCSLVAVTTASMVAEGTLLSFGSSIGYYTLTVICGLLVHALISLPLLALIFGINPLKFALAVFPALSTAFSTASSAATLPITLKSLEIRAGISNRISSFVAPLGATVNMDGTAIYEAVAALFIANMYGIDLSFSEQLIIFLTATFSAVGAAGIPGAGLIMLVLVLNSVGLPVEGISLVVAVDRLLDMLRTCVNVWGDSLGAGIIAVSEGETLCDGQN